MEISEAGLKLIEQFEGFRSERYLDPVGVPTIGYGTTASVISPLPATCTQAQAEGWLKLYVERDVQPALNAAVGSHAVNQNQYDALCSLGYNLGAGIFAASHSIGAALHAGNLRQVAADFLLYDSANGQVLAGLVTRRKAEQKLFNTPAGPPPPPPDPNHYGWFDTQVRDLGNGHQGSEHGIVTEYDVKRKSPNQFPQRLDVLKTDLQALAGRLEAMSRAGQNMDIDHRAWRLTQLAERAQGQQIVK